tara:strand:- start:4144 stop:4308 length:165 start_codon:yes stop_codon:yes gene_type:complete
MTYIATVFLLTHRRDANPTSPGCARASGFTWDWLARLVPRPYDLPQEKTLFVLR